MHVARVTSNKTLDQRSAHWLDWKCRPQVNVGVAGP
jgi:hypothetical protein